MTTTTVDINEVKRHLEHFIARAKAGETIVMMKAGQPQAKLIAIEELAPGDKRKLG